jgi:hypothetical protein
VAHRDGDGYGLVLRVEQRPDPLHDPVDPVDERVAGTSVEWGLAVQILSPFSAR